MTTPTDDELLDMCEALLEQSYLRGEYTPIVARALKSRLAYQSRDEVIEECAIKVRNDCPVCEGSGYGNGGYTNQPEDELYECGYCGRPMHAIRALKSHTVATQGNTR